MPRFCGSCGAQMADAATFCPACGKAASSSAGGTAPAPARVPPAAQPAAGGGLADNIAGLLCYSPVGLIADIIFLVAEPYNRNPFIRFHAFQSLFLCAAWFVVAIALTIVGSILGAIVGPLALIMFPLHMLISLGMLILCIMMMIKAYQMQTPRLPVIGAMAAKQAGM